MLIDFTNGWFTLAGAIIGSLITGAIAWYISRQNQRRSELTVLRGVIVPLVEVHSDVSSVVELRVRGTLVPTVYTQDIRILNTGTEPIKGGRIAFNAADDAQILAPEIVNYPNGASDALKVEPHGAGIHVKFEYVNPDEEYLLRVLLDKPVDVAATFRQEAVKFVFRPHLESAMPALLGDALAISIKRISALHVLCLILVPRYRHYWQDGKNSRPSLWSL